MQNLILLSFFEEIVRLKILGHSLAINVPAHVLLDHHSRTVQLCGVLLLLPIDRLTERVLHVHSVAQLQLLH